AAGNHQPVRRYEWVVEQDVMYGKSVDEVLQWLSQDGKELLEPAQVATVTAPDDRFPGGVRDEIRVHRGQHQNSAAWQTAQERGGLSQVRRSLSGVFGLAARHHTIEVSQSGEAGHDGDQQRQ